MHSPAIFFALLAVLIAADDILLPPPIISPASGTYVPPILVTLASTLPGVSFYYTMDGT